MPILSDAKALINVIERHQNKVLDINTSITELQNIALGLISKRKKAAVRIVFFDPDNSFTRNFGDIPKQLSDMGYEVLWFFGQPTRFLDEFDDNYFFIMGDMMQRVTGIDVIVTASVMDCLPACAKKVLIDHISFAPLEVEHLIKGLHDKGLELPESYSSKKELFEKYTVFMAFLPFYDLILTPSRPVQKLTNYVFEMLGYKEIQTSNHKGVFYNLKENLRKYTNSPSNNQKTLINQSKSSLHLEALLPYVDLNAYSDRVIVAQTGYPKLDLAMPLSKIKPKPIIVYAPTPIDLSGNKISDFWSNAITSKSHGAQIMETLLKNFPEFQVVFKPYANEDTDLVVTINNACQTYANYKLDNSGSDYWDLYSKTKLLVTDFSSTAYTYAVGLQRPVIFFSPNEDKLPVDLSASTYSTSRSEVGVVSYSIEDLHKKIIITLQNYDTKCSEIKNWVSLNFSEIGMASSNGAISIDSLIKDVEPKKLANNHVWYKPS